MVTSYADLARQWWADPTNAHGPDCRDLPCADLRAALSDPEDAGRVSRNTNTSGEARVLSARSAAPVPATFGDLLRKYRMDRIGMTQERLARRVGVSESYISKMETGITVPSRYMTAALADALDLHLGRRINLLDAAGHPARARRAG